MNNMKLNMKRVWLVSFTSTDSRNYYGNDMKRVVANTMENAMSIIKAKYPNAIFVSVSHQGAIDHE